MNSATRIPLLIVGDPAAAACEGDFCEVPTPVTTPVSGQSQQALVNSRLDADLV